MGVVVTWSLIFWIVIAIITIWAIAFFLRKVAYAIVLDENASDVSIHPETTSPDEWTAQDGASRKDIQKFGGGH